MVNRYLKISCLVFLTGFILVGCEIENGLVYQRLTDPNFVIADFATAAIEATGGRQAWARAKKLEFDCVVTLSEPNGGFYLTEHHYEIYPLSNSIRVSAQEPLNKFVWQLSKGQFSILKGDKQNDISPLVGFYRDFAESVLMITTAPVRFLDDAVVFTKMSMPVKMKGLWYYPIQRTTFTRDMQLDTMPAEPYLSNVVFYQNKEDSFVDTIWFEGIKDKKFLLIRGYDYTEIDKKDVLAPTKVEISITDARGNFLQHLAEINFK